MNRSPIVCPECGEGRLRRLDGRHGKTADERWICQGTLEERRHGGTGPFRHKGLIWDVMYIILGEAHKKALAEHAIKIEAMEPGDAKMAAALAQQRFAGTPLPDDVLVDRALRTVYLVDERGSHRRCGELGVRNIAINHVKEALEAQKVKNDPTGA